MVIFWPQNLVQVLDPFLSPFLGSKMAFECFGTSKTLFLRLQRPQNAYWNGIFGSLGPQNPQNRPSGGSILHFQKNMKMYPTFYIFRKYIKYKRFWPQNGVKMTPKWSILGSKMAKNGHFGVEMTPERAKMTHFWPLFGAQNGQNWPFLIDFGVKMTPKWPFLKEMAPKNVLKIGDFLEAFSREVKKAQNHRISIPP